MNYLKLLLLFKVLTSPKLTSEGDYVDNLARIFVIMGTDIGHMGIKALAKLLFFFRYLVRTMSSGGSATRTNLSRLYREGNVEIVTAGMDWGQPYSCESWGTTFGQTFPNFR